MKHASSYWPTPRADEIQLLQVYYTDSIQPQPFLNSSSRKFIDAYESMLASDTLWLNPRPQLETYPDRLVAGEVVLQKRMLLVK